MNEKISIPIFQVGRLETCSRQTWVSMKMNRKSRDDGGVN